MAARKKVTSPKSTTSSSSSQSVAITKDVLALVKKAQIQKDREIKAQGGLIEDYKSLISKVEEQRQAFDFDLSEKPPDHTVFSKMRARIGTKLLSEIFADLRDQLRSQGYMNEVFNFVDASSLISKASLWKERDKAIKDKYEKLIKENELGIVVYLKINLPHLWKPYVLT